MGFRTALTGLNAATSDLGVVANNIANNNTTGFKRSRAEFSDIFSLSSFGTATNRSVGNGVKLSAVTQQFRQGNLVNTGNPLDLAVDGEGFFRLNDDGSIVYTRAGTFGVDREGFVVNSVGQRLTGFQADVNGNLTRTIGDVRLATADIAPQATSEAELVVNLAAGSQPPAAAFDPLDSDSFNHSTTVSVFDSQGQAHSLTVFFVKNVSNSWTVHANLDGTDAAHVSFTGGDQLAFDTSGLLDTTATPQPLGISIDLDAVASERAGGPASVGALSPLVMDLDFTEATQFGGKSGTNSIVQDGTSSGRLVGVNVGEDGTLFGQFTNGQSKTLGQVALTNFRNVQGLSPVGDTAWAQTFSAGEPVTGPPGTASLGLVRAGALEESNVELTEQLVNMINAQRNFQANAQVIATSDSLTQALLNIR